MSTIEQTQPETEKVYEPMTTLLWRTVLSSLPANAVVLDIGAGDGHFTGIAQERGLDVFAFEPRLSLTIKHAGSNVTVVRAAVSNRDDKAPLFHTPFRKYSATLIKDNKENHSHFVQVDTLRLDTYLWGCKQVAAIKFDIEGAEALAIEGARTLIGRNRPTMFVEVLNDRHGQDIEEALPIRCEYYRIYEDEMRIEKQTNLTVGEQWGNFMLLPVYGRIGFTYATERTKDGYAIE